MANRCLYDSRSFVVEGVLEFKDVWHLLGRFVHGSIVSKHTRRYRVRVKPDPRWRGVRQISFCEKFVYETQGGTWPVSGDWFISPYRPRDERFHGNVLKTVREEFEFDDLLTAR